MTAPKRVPRPEHAFIGNSTWRITWLTHDEWESERHDDSADGLTVHSRRLILMRLYAGAPESMYQEVLWHEISHAVWSECYVAHALKNAEAEDLEEQVVGLQSPGLLFVLQQNKEIVKYLVSDGTVIR